MKFNLVLLHIVTLAFLHTMQLQAQQRNFQSETWLGANAGATASMVWFRPTVNQSYLLGYNAGLTFRHISEKNLGVQAEINYSQRGYTELSGNYSRRMDYLELPFLTHIYFGNKVQFFIQLGPKLGYFIGDEVLINQGGSNATHRQLAVSNKFDYGLSGGFGLQFVAAKQSFQLYTRANYSVSNFFPDRTIDYFDNSNHMNASVSLSWLMRVK